ncbi:MAG: sugar phosphate nucleotidyltransferase, partial [Sulfolobaceae archaeon]
MLEESKSVKAIILAAGKGERLEPITHTRPKVFVPVLSKSLIEYLIEILRKYVDDIIIVISRFQEDYFKKLENVKLVFQDLNEKGTAAALKATESYVTNGEEFLVIYGDIFFEESLISKLVSLNASNVIVGVKVKDPRDYGVILSNQEGELINIIEKPKSEYFLESTLVNSGIYKLNYDIFHYIDKISYSPRGELELTDALV